MLKKKYIEIKIEIDEGMIEHIETRKSTVINENENRTTSVTEQVVILTLPTPPSQVVPRDLWTNKIEFLLSVIGYVVDLGKQRRSDNFFFDVFFTL